MFNIRRCGIHVSFSSWCVSCNIAECSLRANSFSRCRQNAGSLLCHCITTIVKFDIIIREIERRIENDARERERERELLRDPRTSRALIYSRFEISTNNYPMIYLVDFHDGEFSFAIWETCQLFRKSYFLAD